MGEHTEGCKCHIKHYNSSAEEGKQWWLYYLFSVSKKNPDESC